MVTPLNQKNAGLDFKKALANKSTLIGTFQKTPSMMISEVLSLSELDVVCIDAEHSPFDRKDIDSCILPYLHADMPVVVRVTSDAENDILNALDCGASGIVVPHVDSAEKAEHIVKKSFYGAGGRGYAGSTRFADYTHSTVAQNIENNNAQTTVIAQIEDLSALEVIDDIMQVDGIDCFFIGVMDLTVALGELTPDAKKVKDAIMTIIESANKYAKTIGMFVAKIEDVSHWQSQGVSLFLMGSDHGFINKGANALMRLPTKR